MNLLCKIADVLTTYARGGAPGSIPKVSVLFTHDPTDIPGMDSWSVKATLSGYEKLDSDGNVVPNFEKSWEVSASDPELCLMQLLKDLGGFLEGALELKESERSAVETSLNLLKADATLAELWPMTPEQAQDVEVAKEEAEGP